MQFFLFLAAALVGALNAQIKEPIGTSLKLPNGLPVGSILTFYFFHTGDNSGWESVAINFYDESTVEANKKYNIPAHIRIDRTDTNIVSSNSFWNGNWQSQTTGMDMCGGYNVPPSIGWWIVDVIKHDEQRMNVFFQGCWAGVRTFHLPLNVTRSVYVISEFVDHNQMQITLKTPNNNTAPPSLDRFESLVHRGVGYEVKLVETLPSFPIGSYIEMIVVLHLNISRKVEPTVGLVPPGSTSYLPKIVTAYKDKFGSRLVIAGSENPDQGTICPVELPIGDLVHIKLERVYHNVIRMSVLYKDGKSTGIICDHPLPIDRMYQMEQPIYIMNQDGAMIFHLEHSIQKAVEEKNN